MSTLAASTTWLRTRPARLRVVVKRQAGTIQGILGAALVAAGTYVQWGAGWALLALGGFLLLGAWGSA